MKFYTNLFVVLLFNFSCFSQKANYFSMIIPEDLKNNANSIVLEKKLNIEVVNQNLLKVKEFRVVKVLNENGLQNLNAYEHYDKSLKIKSIEANIYNNLGELLKNFRRKDFKDNSVADGFSVFTDNRVLYLDYTPTIYPFIMVYESETESNNTAFIPPWYPLSNQYESVLKSSYAISCPKVLGLKFTDKNINDYKIEKNIEGENVLLQATNLSSLKNEDYAPSFSHIAPHFIFGLEKFNLEGVQGLAGNWKEFGLWMYNNLLSGTTEIPLDTQDKIKDLVKDQSDLLNKAKLIYKYVQDKTRYVSIQLGIGGWKPMLAKDVDRLGYGDCKALSNYTRSLLDVAGIPSYYTVIFAGNNKQDIDPKFVSMQGNHAILAIPKGDDYYFLECTSQTKAFDFEGSFTDDRFALVIKPDGGEIVKTKAYNEKNNAQIIKAEYSINENGDIDGKLTITSKGIQYDNRNEIENYTPEKIEEYYKTNFTSISSINKLKANFKHEKESKKFEEKIEISAKDYGKISGNTILFAINAFNQNNNMPTRYRTRNLPLEISRGFYDEDEIEITIPQNYRLQSMPESIKITSQFGDFDMALTAKENKIFFKRTLLIKKGLYDKSEYENYRKFREQIAKTENAKIIIIIS